MDGQLPTLIIGRFSVLIKLGGSKLFLPRDKPQLVCSVFGLNVLGFFVLFSHKYMIELQLSVMY